MQPLGSLSNWGGSVKANLQWQDNQWPAALQAPERERERGEREREERGEKRG